MAFALQKVLRTLHTQQDEMLNEKKHTVKDCIVSIAQSWVRPRCSRRPKIFASKDDRDYRETLIEMDRILIKLGTEDLFVCQHLGAQFETMSDRQRLFRVKVIRKALRHSIVLTLSGLSV